MNEIDVLEKTTENTVELNSEEVNQLIRRGVEQGIPALRIMSAIQKGLETIGRKFEAGEYFLAELIVGGELMKQAIEQLRPQLEKEGQKANAVGKVIIGTVKGDLHDIGKNVCIVLLKAAGFDVVDLGVDIPSEGFIKAISSPNTKVIIGMSGLLSMALPEMKGIIEKLNDRGLRRNIKIILGGAPITDSHAKQIGADAGVNDAVKGVDICKKWA
ncbi:MAG: cobalamin-dependent protein [Candidatus Bathyarchaeia archaeon]|jgi:methanogenic corrinoid protein MtbC1